MTIFIVHSSVKANRVWNSRKLKILLLYVHLRRVNNFLFLWVKSSPLWNVLVLHGQQQSSPPKTNSRALILSQNEAEEVSVYFTELRHYCCSFLFRTWSLYSDILVSRENFMVVNYFLMLSFTGKRLPLSRRAKRHVPFCHFIAALTYNKRQNIQHHNRRK